MNVKTVERLERAFELRMSGMTYEAIAQELGCNKANLHKQMQKAMRERLTHSVDEYRELELARLNELHKSVWDRAVKRRDLWAVDRLLAIQDQRCKLLGLYPKQGESPVAMAQVVIREYGVNPDAV